MSFFDGPCLFLSPKWCDVQTHHLHIRIEFGKIFDGKILNIPAGRPNGMYNINIYIHLFFPTFDDIQTLTRIFFYCSMKYDMI